MAKRTKIQQFGALIGASRRMKDVYRTITKAARVNMPVLITGETGTGKDLVAREIHERSRRKEAPFVTVNTGTLAPQLIASELFGHVKGAFTGAVSNKIGRFAEADGGTFFLDEIATIEEPVQIALLRVLETGAFRPVGARRGKRADVRLITATNVDLREAVSAGRFREDLLHRLEVFQVFLPPLRDRLSDLPMLAHHFLEGVNNEFGLAVKDISDDVLNKLRGYAWPGNIRELRNTVAQAAVLAEHGQIRLAHLPSRIVRPSRLVPQRQKSIADMHRALPIETRKGLITTAKPMIPFSEPSSSTQDGVFIPVGVTLEEVRRTVVLKTLAACAGNKTHAANILGISRKSLYDLLARWGIHKE